MVSSSTNTPQRAGRSPLLLSAFVAGLLCVTTFLPRVVLTASDAATTRAQPANNPVPPSDERLAMMARVERLLDSSAPNKWSEAGRLMDGLASEPLFISDGDSAGEKENEAAFSSGTLIAKLARQFDAEASRAVSPTTRSAPTDETNALQWTHRTRRIADALMLSPRPSLIALKTAHYLDTIAGKREAIVFRACGKIADATAAERQNKLLDRVWREEILFGLERIKRDLTTNDRPDAEWATQMNYLVGLYQKERSFMSQA